MIDYLFVLILITIIITLNYRIFESFKSINSKFISDNEIFSDINNETNVLNDIFKKISLDQNMNLKDYIYYNANLPFTFTKPFKLIISDFSSFLN